MREIDYESHYAIKDKTIDLVSNVKNLPTDQKIQKLSTLNELFKAGIKFSERKVNLALHTYDIVDKHVQRLDEDLKRYEEEKANAPIAPPKVPKPPVARQMKEKRTAIQQVDKRSAPDTPPKQNKRSRTQRHEEQQKEEVTSPPRPTTARVNAMNNAAALIPPTSSSQPLIGVSQIKASISSNSSNEASSKPARSTTRRREEVRKKEADTTEFNVDANEPTYCICQQVSYGEMIGCDNEDCEIEWFHYSCVGLTSLPRGSWFCPQCVEDRKVIVTGSFDDWNQTLIAKRVSDDLFEAKVDLAFPDGKITYKFIVDGVWKTCSKSPICVDEHGNENNFMIIPPLEQQQIKVNKVGEIAQVKETAEIREAHTLPVVTGITSIEMCRRAQIIESSRTSLNSDKASQIVLSPKKSIRFRLSRLFKVSESGTVKGSHDSSTPSGWKSVGHFLSNCDVLDYEKATPQVKRRVN